MPQEPNGTPELRPLVGVFEVACQKCDKQRLRLPKDVELSVEFRYTCKDCCRDQPVPDASGSDTEKREKGKETSRRWRAKHKEEAAEYQRAKRAGDTYANNRKALMSDAAWEARLKELGYMCSTPGCGRSLSFKTAIRSAEGPTYVPVCASCLGSKAAETRWTKKKKSKGSE